MSHELRRKFLISLVIALLVYIALGLYSDWNQLTDALSDFPWIVLVPVLGLTLLNYVGRGLRWHWYLRLLEVPISLRDSSRVFGVGMMMVMTPGKAGEFLKCYMVKNVAGTPMSVTAPVILAERLLDGAAMLLLAAAGLFAFPNTIARLSAAVVLTNFLFFVMIIQSRPVALRLLAWAEMLPVVNRYAVHFHTAYESAYIIFGPRNLAISLLIGVCCWAAEGVGYYLVLLGFGAQPGAQILMIAVFIFSISTVIGAVFAMPGGLGGVEGSLVALSVQLLGLTVATATAAALLIRFCTLWLGVLVGVVSLALWPYLLAGAEQVRREQAPAAGEGQAAV
jgi:uncharacterized protein (TIRG00374 family)